MAYKYCPQCSSALGTRLVAGRERLTCPEPGCGYVVWGNPVPVVAIVVETSQGILLAHNRTWPKGVYSMITGFLESAETPEEAAKREVVEELGLHPLSVNFIGNFVFSKLNQLILAFHITVEGKAVLNDELDEVICVQKNELIGWEETHQFQVGEWLNRLKVRK